MIAFSPTHYFVLVGLPGRGIVVRCHLRVVR